MYSSENKGIIAVFFTLELFITNLYSDKVQDCKTIFSFESVN